MKLTAGIRRGFLVEPALAVLLWGGTFTAAKFGLREMPVLTFLAARIPIALPLLFAIGPRSPVTPARSFWWRSMLAPGLAQLAFQLLFLQGLERTSASASAILLGASPLVAAVWLAVTTAQRLMLLQWLGLLLGLGGVVLVMGGTGLELGQDLLGNLLAFAASIAWAWFGIAVGPAARATGPARAAGWSLALAGCTLLPLAAPEAATVDWSHVSVAAWTGLLYMAIFGLAAATALWVRSIERWGPQATMNYTYLEPVTGVAIAAIALGERLFPIQGVGAALVLAGIYLASRREEARA